MASSTILQQSSIVTFQSKPASPKSFPIKKPSIKLSLSQSLPKLTLSRKSTRKTKHAGSASGARMSATAASSYASALADVASATKTLDATAGDVEKIETIFSDPAVADFFSNPVIALEKKREILDQISASASLQPHTINFLNILIDMKRIDIIKDIVKEFELVYNKITETELAVVTSVVPLESQHLAQIAKGVQRLTGAKNVRIKTVLDPSLVAGFTIRFGSGGSKLVDMSVKKQLEEIAAQLDVSDIKLAPV